MVDRFWEDVRSQFLPPNAVPRSIGIGDEDHSLFLIFPPILVSLGKFFFHSLAAYDRIGSL